MNTTTNALLDNINAAAKQIVGMLATGPVTLKRAMFCTADKFSEHEIASALKLLNASGIANYRGGAYVLAA